MSKLTSTIAASKSESAKTKSAASGARSAKPVRKKRSKRKSVAKPKPAVSAPPANPLPPPVEVNLPSSESSPQPIQFPPSQSLGGLETSSEDPLSAESERLLSFIPETIADAGQEQFGGIVDGPQESEASDAVVSLMQMVAFEPQDVQDQLCELFEWLADRFHSDHWELTERQAGMLGKPTAQLLNSIWARLMVILPDVLGKWCMETPGATAFLLACGIVVVPKAAKQWNISREAKKVGAAGRMVQPSTSHGPAPVHSRPPLTAADMVQRG